MDRRDDYTAMIDDQQRIARDERAEAMALLRTGHAVRAATAEYRDESDVLGSFLAERTTTEPEYAGATARVAAGALFKAYQAWCLAGGLRPDSQTAFGRELTKRGFAAQAGGGGANFRMGLRLIAADEATGEGVDGF